MNEIVGCINPPLLRYTKLHYNIFLYRQLCFERHWNKKLNENWFDVKTGLVCLTNKPTEMIAIKIIERNFFWNIT